jgi:hypothetical protein
MNQSTPLLGQPPGENDRRDAIHIAIAPVIASGELRPGQHVGPLPDQRFGVVDKPIGIVDPFLLEPVKDGQPFWLCLYPYTITSLRHVWTHPSFKPTPPSK